ncbi:unnamed protein product [Rhizophagus irregularis]|nr:unnamed protein product [Rhizophagus irregularis]
MNYYHDTENLYDSESNKGRWPELRHSAGLGFRNAGQDPHNDNNIVKSIIKYLSILESPSAPARKPCLVDVNEEISDDGSGDKEDDKEEETELIEESSTKAQVTMSKTQMKKMRKRNNRMKK